MVSEDETMNEKPVEPSEMYGAVTPEVKALEAEKVASGLPEPETDHVRVAKEACLARLQALFDAKLAAAHEWATKNAGMPRIVLTVEEMEEVFK